MSNLISCSPSIGCQLFQGIPLGCRNSIAGIRTIYFANFDNVSGVTFGDSSGDNNPTGCTITEIDMVGGTTFYEFDLRREVGQYTEAIQSNIQNGTLFYEGTLSFFLEKIQTYIRNQVVLLATAKTIAIILDKNNNYWLIGAQNGMDLTSGTVDTGKASADANGYTLAFIAQEQTSAYPVDPSVINSGIIQFNTNFPT